MNNSNGNGTTWRPQSFAELHGWDGPTTRNRWAGSAEDAWFRLVQNLTGLQERLVDTVLDPRRDINDECGFPETSELTPEFYRELYDRHAIAKKVVDWAPEECWMVQPSVYESDDESVETDFERAWDELGQSLRGEASYYQDEHGSPVWEYLERADRMSRIGHFGVILLGIDDGRNLQEPADGAVVFNQGAAVPDDLTSFRAGLELNFLNELKSGPKVTNEGTDAFFSRKGTKRFPRVAPQLTKEEAETVDNWRREAEVLTNWEQEAGDRYGPELGRRAVKYTPRGVVVNAYKYNKRPWDYGERHLTWNQGKPVYNAPKRQDPQYDQTFRPPWSPAGTTSPQEPAPAYGETYYPNAQAPYGESWPYQQQPSPQDLHPTGTEQQYRAEPTTAPGIFDGMGGMAPRFESGQQGDTASSLEVDTSDFGATFPGGNTYPYGQQPGEDAPKLKTPGELMGEVSPLGGGLAGTEQQYFGVQFGPSEQPSPTPSARRRKLLFLRVFDESLVQIVRYEWSVRNPRFGQPVMYRITLNDPRETHSGVGLPLATVFVHWSRVIHLADNKMSSEVFGVPAMRPVINNLLGLAKLYGASPEGYWKSCFTALALSTHPQLGGDVAIDYSRLQDMIENYQNGLQRVLALVGMGAQTLAPSVVDPGPHIEKQMEAICITLGAPRRKFSGSEQGDLASTQDNDTDKDRKQRRHHNYLTPRVIVPFADRLIQLGVLPKPSADALARALGQQPGSGGAALTPQDYGGGYVDSGWQQGGYGQAGDVQDPQGLPPADWGADAAGGTVAWQAGQETQSPNGQGGQEWGYRPSTNRRIFQTKPGRWLVVTNGRPSRVVRRFGRGYWVRVLNAAGPSNTYVSQGGYSVEWPDLHVLSEKDKAMVAQQQTASLTQFIAGGGEQAMTLKDFYVRVWGMTTEEADEVLQALQEQQEYQAQFQQPDPGQYGGGYGDDGSGGDPNGGGQYDDQGRPGGGAEGDGEAQEGGEEGVGPGGGEEGEDADPDFGREGDSAADDGDGPGEGPDRDGEGGYSDSNPRAYLAQPGKRRLMYNVVNAAPHDVSGERRDPAGKWTAGGSGSKAPATEPTPVKRAAVRGKLVSARREGKGKDAKVLLHDGSPAPGHITPAMIPPAWKGVRVSLDPGADVLVTAKDAKGRTKTVYHPRYLANNQAAKFAKIQEGLAKQKEIAAQNQQNRKSPDAATREAADCVWLMQEQATRPGSDADTKGYEHLYGQAMTKDNVAVTRSKKGVPSVTLRFGEHAVPVRDEGTKGELIRRAESGQDLHDSTYWLKSHGATTLEARHVVEAEDGVRLQFVGKEGVWHDHLIRNKPLADMLLSRKRTAGERGGKLFDTDYNKVSAYSKTLDGGRFTPKDFRTMRATALAVEAIKAQPDCCKTDDEYKKSVMAVAERVSGVLGNRPQQALMSYIAPEVFSAWRHPTS